MIVGVDAPDPDEQSGNELIGVVAQDEGVRIIIKAPLDDTSGILIFMAGVSTQGSPGGLCSSVYVLYIYLVVYFQSTWHSNIPLYSANVFETIFQVNHISTFYISQ